MNMKIQIMDQKTSVCIAVLLLTVFLEYGSVAKKLSASQAFDNTWQTDVELENELEQKRAKGNPAGWSSWSDWSTCSRACDGGVAHQTRRCLNENRCRGDTTRFRLCNMQPCPEHQDFRAHQCNAYNNVPYDGTLYKWTTHYDYEHPCTLTCRGRPAHHSDDVSLPEVDDGGIVTGPDELEHYDEPSVIVQLSDRVQDGTRCHAGSLDMCIQGKCQRVGCDLKIGSTKKIDGCGVCGGDGKSCSQPLYQWEMAPMSLCSVTCGGGYKMSRPTCRNRVSGVEVEDSLCSTTNRPEPSMVSCNTHTCPTTSKYKWVVEDEWIPCNRLCGPGYKERIVLCAEETNGITTKVPDILCQTPKPPTQESCMLQECPRWEVEQWSECSATCGNGIQMRGVECKISNGSLSAKCDSQTKPLEAKQCATGLSCNADEEIDEQIPGEKSKSDEDDFEAADEEYRVGGEEELENVKSFEQVSYNDQPIYAHQQSNRLHHEELVPKAQSLIGGGESSEPEHPTSDPTFIKDTEWSACSVTCGDGIRRRPYKCKIFLEYSRTIATVNDSLCEGPRPHDEVERCAEEPCMLPSHDYDEHQYPRDSIKVGVSEPGKTYVWREQGYTSCSASCLGGVEELIVNCVREDNERVVSPFLCPTETKPEARVRTCNDRPCPPRWNYFDYTPCSKSCGIGIKTREVQCIHEVTRGGENAMVVPNSMCPQPPPADRQYCNVLDCPVRWELGEWSKCSHKCGYGIKERKVECRQIMAQEHKIERPESMCPSAKPADKKPCNVKPCPPEDPKPMISSKNSTYIQHDPTKAKLTLKVGGAAVVFFGTQVKIKCPVKRYDRTKIRWTKDHKPLPKLRKFKVSKKGALRVLDITFRDAGVYSCHAGLSTAEINIGVKAKPGGIQPEDFEKQESDRLVREPLTSADMTSDVGPQNTQRKQKQQANGRERSRRPKSDGSLLNADGSLVEDENHLIQQALGGVPARSSGNRVTTFLSMPHFEALLDKLQILSLQYLWPLKKLSSSKGYNSLMKNGLQFGIDFDKFEKKKPIRLQIVRIMKELILNDRVINDAVDILRHKKHTLVQLQLSNQTQHRRNANEITSEWMTSHCTESSEHFCLGTGFRKHTESLIQVTPVTSALLNDNSTVTTDAIVDYSECEDSVKSLKTTT